jgi:hypothetical protein
MLLTFAYLGSDGVPRNFLIRQLSLRSRSFDLMAGDAFKAGANESDWFNWDVVVRALEIQEVKGEDQLWSH